MVPQSVVAGPKVIWVVLTQKPVASAAPITPASGWRA
jgi:hypothetical protein